MSEDNSLDIKKQTYEKLAFIHQVLTQSTRYPLEEFKVAESSIRMITEMANKLSDEIKSELDVKAPPEAASNE